MINLQAGDIFLTNSNKTGAKIVKFMQTSPTIWHWLVGIRSSVNYFHAGMIINNVRLIEQLNKVGYSDSVAKILTREVKIFRYKPLTDEQALRLMFTASRDVGRGYDILLIIGKTFTWLTGIKWFVRHIESKEKEICVSIIGKWFWEIDQFGLKNYNEITTDIIDDWCSSHLEKWELIYEN